MPAFLSVPRVLTGRGCLASLGDEAARLGDRALVVTGRAAMRRAGITQRALEILQAKGLSVATFEDVEPEPTPATVDRGRVIASARRCSLVVALGGGSALDAGKAIAALAREHPPTEDFARGREITTTGIPTIAVPTTAGTGSEVTKNSVITLPDERTKTSIRGDGLLPSVAIVDPELTVPLPPDLTAASGLDALTQAIESYISIHATPLTEALSLRASELLARNLEAAWADGSDLAAREACCYGSLMAGIALANARLGVVHGIAHPVGARYHVPHGLVCAVLLPHALRLNQPAVPQKFRILSHAMGAEPVDAVERLLDRFGIPRTLGSFGLLEDDFETLVEQSLPSGSLKANPKKVDADDVRAILRAVSG